MPAGTSRAVIAATLAAVGAAAALSLWWSRRPEPPPDFAAPPETRVAEEAPAEAPTSEQAPASGPVLRVYFQPFDDGEASLAQLRQILPLLPRREVTAATGVHVRSLLPDLLRVSGDRLPRTLALMERYVYRDEGDETVTVVPETGRVFLPAVPLAPAGDEPVGYGRSTVRKAADAIASIFDQHAFILSAPGDRPQSGAGGQIADFALPAGLVANARTVRLADTGAAALIFNPIDIATDEDATTAPVTATSLLTPEETASLSMIAQQSTAPSVDLFIADLDVPRSYYDASMRRLHDLCQEARGELNLPPAAYPNPVYAGLTSSSHAAGVEEALKELVALPGNRVRVTFVPLSKAQNVGPVLEELLYVAEMIRIRRNYPNLKIPTSRDANAVTAARAALDSLPSVPKISRTDGALLEALDLVAAIVANKTDARYVINYSWWVPKGGVSIPLPDRRGLVVSAAGNNGADLSKDPQDFAARALTHDTFLTVMNVDSKGAPAGNSAKFPATALKHARVVGFSGSTALHGSWTSWAAPRVAWLLAFAEGTPRTREATATWLPEMQERIRKLHPGGPPYASISIGAAQLAQLWRY